MQYTKRLYDQHIPNGVTLHDVDIAILSLNEQFAGDAWAVMPTVHSADDVPNGPSVSWLHPVDDDEEGERMLEPFMKCWYAIMVFCQNKQNAANVAAGL